MADIVLTCDKCGNRFSVSEYVAAGTLVCTKCKSTVTVPARAPDLPVAQRLKLAKAGPEPDAGPETLETVEAAQYRQTMPDMRRSARRRVRRRGSSAHLVWPWMLFLVLAVVLSYLRFFKGAADVNLIVKAAITVLFVLHFTVVTLAFADDSFSGVLCAIIPGYSLFYLFFQADQFYLRAVVAALLIAFGWDTTTAIGNFLHESYVSITCWIENTDTLKKSQLMR